jgi:hypothetical protein
VYYVGEQEGWNYIVFEFIDGINIRDLVERKGRLSEAEALSYSLQVAEALAHAAMRDVVHRDIKPSNILVMPDGRAKLVDMGLARLHQVDAPAADLTATGVTLGTFDYISPEQARDPRSADVRSDLYSLGCTLYYMLTGVPPFPEGTVLQKLLSHSSEPPPNPQALRPELEDDIAAVALKLMAKLPGQRYQSPRELISDLVVLAERRGLFGIARAATSADPLHRTWRQQLARQIPWLVPALLLVVAGVALRFVWQGPRSRQQIEIARPQLLPAVQNVESAAPAAAPADSPAGASGDAPRSVPGHAQAGASAPVADGSGRSGDGAGVASAPGRSARASANGELDGPAAPNPAETAGLAAAGQPPATAPTAQDAIDGEPQVVVAVSPLVSSSGEEVVPTLTAALQRARENPAINTIELRVNQLEESTLTVDLRRSLTIRAGAGYRPLLTLRPTAGEFLAERRIIKLMGSHVVRWEGLDIRLELPYEPAPFCALFHLNQVDGIVLSRCTLTIQNEWGGPAAFFSVQAPRFSSTIGGDEAAVVNLSPTIELQQTAARGQATLVRAISGLPFWLRWNQGLFASTERMIEAGGVLEGSDVDVVRVELSHVTASMAQGLGRVTVDDMGPHLPGLVVRCDQCVITHHEDWPLVEHVGAFSVDEAANRFRFAGEQNFYESTSVRWRVQTETGETHEFLWADRDHPWYEEEFAERVVRWAYPYSKKPVDQQTIADFRVDAMQRRLAGFDEAQLPPFPPRAGDE